MRRHQRQNIAEAKEDCLEAVLHLRVDMLGPEDPKLKCTFGNQVAWGHFRQKREVTGIKSRKFHIRSLVSDSICSTRVVIGFSVAVALTCATFLFLSYYPALYLCSWAPDLPKPSPPPERTYQERADFVETEVKMKRQYLPLTSEHNPLGGYDIFDCPLEPPPFYPIESPIMDVLRHWPLSDTELRNQRTIHQGLCVFDFARHGQERVRKQIHNYRQAEKPFIIKNDPEVLKTVERWNTNNYLDYRLQGKVYRGEFSRTLSMMYWTVSKFHKVPKDFIPPTNMRPTTFELWKERAQAMENPTIATQRKDENSYLRFDGCVSPTKRCDALHRMWGAMGKGIYMLTRLDDGDFLHDELPWFSPRYYKHGISNDYLVEPEKARGIQCRFGVSLCIRVHLFAFSSQSSQLHLGKRIGSRKSFRQ